MGWLRKVGRKIGKGIKKLGKAIGKGFKKVFKAFGNLGPLGHLGLAIIFPAFTGIWGTLGKGIQGISQLSPAVGKVFQAVYNIGSKVKGVYNSVTGALTNTLKKIPGVGQAMEGLDKFIDRARQMIGIDAGNVPLADKEDITEYWNSMSNEELAKLELSKTDLFANGKLTEFGENAGRGKMFVEQMSERGFGTVAEIEKGYNFSSDAFSTLENRIRMEDYAAFSENNLNNLPSSYKYNFEQKTDSMGRKGEWEWIKKPVITPKGPTGVKVEDFKPVAEVFDTSTVSDKSSLNKATKQIIEGSAQTPVSFKDKVKKTVTDTGVQTVEDFITGRDARDYQDYLKKGNIGQTPETVAASSNYVQDLRGQFQQAGFQTTNSNDFINQFMNGATFGSETYNNIMAQQPIGANLYV